MTSSPITPSWLAENATLCNVHTRRLAAEKPRPGRAVKFDISLRKSYGRSKGHIHFELSCAVDAQNKSGEVIGKISVEAVGSYRIGDSPPEFLPAETEEFGDQVAIKDIFPYVRQAVDMLAAQVGFEKVRIAAPDLAETRPKQAALGDSGEVRSLP
ncbi:hypothetical protein [Kitasatospora purpeofusca]|uniref:hypothetical protein n=1 Tax=Kitasatospora purpeofusca TaxID=67352 RepID=UPI0036958CA5